MKRQEKDVGQSPDESFFLGLTTIAAEESARTLGVAAATYAAIYVHAATAFTATWIRMDFFQLKIPSFLKTWRGCNRLKGAFLPMRWGHPPHPL